MKKKQNAPRNPYVLHILKNKNAGAHSKKYKVERRDMKIATKNSPLCDRQVVQA